MFYKIIIQNAFNPLWIQEITVEAPSPEKANEKLFTKDNPRHISKDEWMILTTERCNKNGAVSVPINKKGTEETIEVILDEKKYPIAFKRRLDELMSQKAFNSEAEARKWLSSTPIVLELYYERDCGLYAVESEVLEFSKVYSPYTGEPMLDPEEK